MTGHDQSPEEELVAVEHAASRLAERFPRIPRDRIEQLVRERHEEFSGAPVRDFVPVLVEHDVKRQLASETGGASA
ncbi:three-helix bundle dimerization domain-containing protein [Leifsonia sp. NPDC058194]|uniref:three-helix bundle dimerization domain-containing protein n=1 Tax=Leifsonia sp. NPDC058194 TaxID=3346374 RepID=UPI0036DB8E6C